MDLVNVVNGETYDERNIPGRCKLCILKCASFLMCFFILCSSICVKILEKYGLKSSLRSQQANSLNSLKVKLFTFIVSLDKLVLTINLTSIFFSCYIGQSMVREGKLHLVPSYEDVTILIRNYEANTVTKFSCFSSNKGFRRIGMHYYDNLLTYGSEFRLPQYFCVL